MSSTLPAPVQGYIDASNAFDGDALIAWFADDALVNDRREFWDKDAVRAWLDREIIGDKVTTSPSATAEHYGDVIVHPVTDGEYEAPSTSSMAAPSPRPDHPAQKEESHDRRQRTHRPLL